MGFRYSKGSAQSEQDQMALHAVEPNSERWVVRNEPHAGHSTTGDLRCSGMSSVAIGADPDGGAMPYARRRSRASSLIQSVVHAGW
jgi:hypothetical protein